MNVYLAGPLFGVAEREFNSRLAALIRARAPEVQFVLPQEKARQLLQAPGFERAMFEFCLEAIDRVDLVLAVMDGSDADSGTCIECGYAYAKGVPVVSIRTDLRGSELNGLNLMVAGVSHALVLDTQPDVTAERIADAAVVVLRNAYAQAHLGQEPSPAARPAAPRARAGDEAG